jgi:hypothetical protein
VFIGEEYIDLNDSQDTNDGKTKTTIRKARKISNTIGPEK